MSRLLVALVMALFVGPAAGATVPSDLFGSEETVSIATGRVQSLRTAPAVATVITAEDIRNGGFRNVVEALQLVPGFHLGISTSYYPNLLVRGFSSPWSAAVLVLLDGVAQTDLVAGNAFGVLGTIPLDVIERIEVTRGPGSSQFGADAFSAVVNVITKKQARSSQFTLSGGSYETANGRLLLGAETPSANGRLLLGAETPSADVVFGAELMRTNGHEPTIDIDRLTGLDALLGTSSSYAPSEVKTERRNGAALLNASFGATRGMLRLSRWRDYGLGAGLLGVVDPVGSTSLQTVEGRLDQDVELSDRADLTLRLDAAQTRLDFEDVTWLPPSMWLPGGLLVDTSAEQDLLRARADLRFDASERHFLTAGIGYEYGRYEVDTWEAGGAYEALGTLLGALQPGPGGALPGAAGFDPRVFDLASRFGEWLAATGAVPDYDGSRRLLFGYLQDEWLVAPKWSLTWGVRVDDYSDVGTELSPRAVLIWTPRPAWTTKLLRDDRRGRRLQPAPSPLRVAAIRAGPDLLQPTRKLRWRPNPRRRGSACRAAGVRPARPADPPRPRRAPLAAARHPQSPQRESRGGLARNLATAGPAAARAELLCDGRDAVLAGRSKAGPASQVWLLCARPS